MSIVIRDADLVQDQSVLIKTLNENRSKSTDESRFRWRYLENPHGQAKAWLAIDERQGTIAGFTVVHPRLICIENQEVLCWNCGDFSINKRYRTLGVAVKLRSAATKFVDQNEVPFLYAHPNDKMTLIHLKAGHKILGQMVRYAIPLGFDRYLPNSLKKSAVSSGLGWAYHKGIATWKGASHFKQSFQCELHDVFPEDAPYKDLLLRVQGQLKLFGLRDNVYLKWRFGMTPLLKVFTLLLYTKGDLVGYAICSWQERVINVHDIFSLQHESVMNGLVAHLTEVAHSLKAQGVSVVLLESNPIIQSLRRNGYILRPEHSNVIVHSSPHSVWQALLHEKKNWFMTIGDRDV